MSGSEAVVTCFSADVDEPLSQWSEAAIAAAIRFSPGGIIVTDPRRHDNPIVFCNPGFSAISGYSSDECRGRNCRFLQCDDTDRDVVQQMRAAIHDAQPFHGRLLNARKNGELWWNEVSINPIFDDAGELRFFVGLQLDVTSAVRDEAALRESENRYRLLCDNSTDMIARHAPDGTYLDISPACFDLLGYTPRELLGHSPYDLFHPDDLPRLRTLHNRVLDAPQTQTLEYRIRHADGRYRWVETTSRMLRDERNLSKEIISVTRDVRERRSGDQKREEEREARRARELSREQNARNEAENAVARLQALQNITDVALFNLDSDELLSDLMSRIRGALHADSASLFLLHDDTLLLRAVDGQAGEHVDEQNRFPIAMGEGVVGSVAEACRALLLRDVSQVHAASLFDAAPIRGALCVPLCVGERLIGVFHVGSLQPEFFVDDDLQLLQLIADRAATAIERGRLFAQVKRGNEQLHALSRRLLEVQENERRHIARELHDEIGQLLTAVKISLQNAQNLSVEASSNATSSTRCAPEIASESASERAETPFAECIEVVEQAIGHVRQMSVALRPPVLDVLGLVAALREYSDRVAQRSGFVVHLVADTISTRPCADVETACFRVAQEALTNIARHAKATQVEITLRVRLGTLHLLVCDDGEGFDLDVAMEASRRGESLGIVGMEERAILTGGQFQLLSRLGHGTQLRASFDMNNGKNG